MTAPHLSQKQAKEFVFFMQGTCTSAGLGLVFFLKCCLSGQASLWPRHGSAPNVSMALSRGSRKEKEFSAPAPVYA